LGLTLLLRGLMHELLFFKMGKMTCHLSQLFLKNIMSENVLSDITQISTIMVTEKSKEKYFRLQKLFQPIFDSKHIKKNILGNLINLFMA
jgi:hypothetical protein